MPTRDRRPRPRRRASDSSVDLMFDQVLDELRAGNCGIDRWRELRPRAIRALLREKPAMTAETAAQVCDAFHAKPQFIPMRRPRVEHD
jgi:hypothetical protein